MKKFIIGIDLGTTHSSVAVAIDGQITVIKDHEQCTIPSVVGIYGREQMAVGEIAKQQQALYPEQTVRSIKRHMGRGYCTVLEGEAYTPQELSALILRHLKKLAEQHLGEAVTQAVVTVPAHFSDVQRQATKEAGVIAGLEIVRMINEPTAAALAYDECEGTSRRLLVYDLGGGTFDVSVVEIDEGVVEVLASHGNTHLGGDDFDAKIVSKILDSLLEQGVNLSSDRVALSRIQQAAEAAKITLSGQPFVKIIEKNLTHSHQGESVDLDWELSREDYEEMIQPFVDETLNSVYLALRQAELVPEDIDQVILVGGCTATPLIQRRLKSLFHQQPHVEIDPSLCVVTGAAKQAAAIAGEPVSGILVDITPHTFGISTLDTEEGDICPYSFMPIIEKNSVLPIEKSEVFYTTTDGQSSVEINVYQGDDPDALKNSELGRFMVEGLSDVPLGNPVLISFKLDLDGLLHVTAKEKNSGLKKTVVIDGAAGGLSQQALYDSKARIRALVDYDRSESDGFGCVEQDENSPLLFARAVIMEAEEEILMHTDGEALEKMVVALESLKRAVCEKVSDEEIFKKIGDISYLISIFRFDHNVDRDHD